jgi:hypothetical protein
VIKAIMPKQGETQKTADDRADEPKSKVEGSDKECDGRNFPTQKCLNISLIQHLIILTEL